MLTNLIYCDSTSPLGGHKGYGLAMMVDVFCGILSGSSFGPTMRKWQGDNERVADLVRYTQLKDLNPELHDAVAVLYHLSHQDNLELVVMCVHDNPLRMAIIQRN